MYKHNKKSLKIFLDSEFQNSEELFSKKTVNGLIRSLLEPVAANNAKSLIFTRFKDTREIEGIIKRLEYCSNVEMFSFLDFDTVLKDDLVEMEFVIITSHRYNAVLLWDYSGTPNKDATPLYIKVNSKDVNEVFETVKDRLKTNFDEKFYSYRPERRENALLNDAIYNVLKILNENIKENEFNLKEQENIADRLQTQDRVDEINANIRSCAHEIKNQLSVLDIYAKILEKQLGQDKNLGLIKKSISLIRLQLDDLRAGDNLNFEEKDLKEVVRASIGVFEQILPERNNTVKFTDNIKGKALVLIDEERFFAVLNNLVKNADESTTDDEIEIRIEADEKFAKIFVKNHGEKIPGDIQNKLFMEGFSTKKDGWGLGLNICRKYLAAQLGSISLVKSDDSETEFLVTIPLLVDGIN